MAHLAKITAAFELSVLTLTVPGLRGKNFKILKCFRISTLFSFSVTADFRINGDLGNESQKPQAERLKTQPEK
jgi:hypothetical protein